MKITRNSRLLLALICLILILLYLASTTDLLFKEGEKAVYHVSVLIDSYTDEGWENFKIGMDQASMEYNVDINFVTLISENTPVSQSERVSREIENHAQALILYTENAENLTELLESVPGGVPVISLGKVPEPYESQSIISPDWQGMGRDLAQRLIKDQQGKECRVLLLRESGELLNIAPLEKAFEVALTADGIPVEKMEIHDAASLEKIIQKAFVEKLSVAVLEPALLLKMIGAVQGSGIIIPLYGQGWSVSVRRALDNHMLSAVAAANTFEQGYMAVQQAVRLIAHPAGLSTDQIVGHVVAGLDDMYRMPSEIILFPIR